MHIVNLGPAPLRIGELRIGGADSRDFRLGGTCMRKVIHLYAACTITVRFTPRRRGVRHAALIIIDNSATSPRAIPLSGIGRP